MANQSGFHQAHKTIPAPGPRWLPVLDDGKQIVSCWRLTLRERLSALIFGRVWVGLHVKVDQHPPIWVDCKRTVFSKAEEE